MLEITNMAAMWNFEFVSGNFSIFEICSSGQKIEVFAAIKILPMFRSIMVPLSSGQSLKMEAMYLTQGSIGIKFLM
jgi:hypothetical protein